MQLELQLPPRQILATCETPESTQLVLNNRVNARAHLLVECDIVPYNGCFWIGRDCCTTRGIGAKLYRDVEFKAGFPLPPGNCPLG